MASSPYSLIASIWSHLLKALPAFSSVTLETKPPVLTLGDKPEPSHSQKSIQRYEQCEGLPLNPCISDLRMFHNYGEGSITLGSHKTEDTSLGLRPSAQALKHQSLTSQSPGGLSQCKGNTQRSPSKALPVTREAGHLRKRPCSTTNQLQTLQVNYSSLCRICLV